MYSLRMSFWIVPRSRLGSIPCRRATVSYRASRIAAVALMVMLVLTASSRIPAKRASMSAIVSIGTPTRPTSPSAIGSSLS